MMQKAPATPAAPGTTSKEGSALLMVIVILLIVTGICTVSLTNSLAVSRLSQRQVWREQNFYATQSGLETAAYKVNSELLGSGTQTETFTLENGVTVEVATVHLGGDEYAATASTTHEGIELEQSVRRFFRPYYSEYGTFYEKFNLWWIPGQVVEGKVWTRERQKIYGYTKSNGEKEGPIFKAVNQTGHHEFGGDPEFGSYVHPTKDASDYANRMFWNEDDTKYETGVYKPPVMDVDFDAPKVAASGSGGLLLRGRTEIRFGLDASDNGIVEIRNMDRYGDFDWHPVSSETLDLIYVEEKTDGDEDHRGAELTLGDPDNQDYFNIVKGSLTVWSEDDVTLPNHILYDNADMETSSDKLAVISKDDIWIDWDREQDLEIHGTLMATGAAEDSGDGGIGLLDYANGTLRGVLNIRGSLIAERKYPSGTISLGTGELNSGFQIEQEWDHRFATQPPPFMPVIENELTYEGWY